MAIESVSVTDAASATKLIAADLSGSQYYQMVKVVTGPDGTFNAVSNAIPMPVSTDTLAISRGLVTGMATVNKFGQNPAVASGTQEDIWDGATDYTYPTTADITHLRQAVDDATMRPGGVGADIQVQGLDTNWALVTQTKALDGTDTTTPVALATALKRVFRMKVMEDIVAAQDVELRNVGGGTDYAIIQAGNNQTLMAMYTVPAGKTAYITNYYGSTAITTAQNPANTLIKLWTADRANSYEFQLKHIQASTKENPHFQHTFDPPLAVTGQTDIKMTGLPADKAANIYAGFDLILVDD